MFDNTTTGGCAPPEGEMINPSQKQLCFRPLRADEVEVRPAESKGGKVTLLLYQDARCAMNILDETLGPHGWQKRYYEAAGLLFCDLGIYNPETKQLEWKSDTGSKSNIEEDKGLASDAFKRSAVAWGIGRELYTAPRITIDLTEKDMFNGKLCQSFKVKELKVTDGNITTLTIVDKWGNQRYPAPTISSSAPQEEAVFTSTNTEQTDVRETSITNEDRIRLFCEEKRNEPGIDQYQLQRFEAHYLGPSKEDPTKSIAEKWKGVITAPKLWNMWLERTYKSNYRG